MEGMEEASDHSNEESSHAEKQEGVKGKDKTEDFKETDDNEESKESDVESETESVNDDKKIDILSGAAMENAYYICHNVQVKG